MTAEAALVEDIAPDTSLRDTISAAYDEHSTEPAEGVAAPPPADPSVEPVPSQSESQQPERARGPDGRFVEQPKDAKAPAAPKEVKTPDASTATVKQPDATPPAAQTGVPATLNPAEQAQFAKLSPDAQEFIRRREQAVNVYMSQKGHELVQLRQQLSEFNDVTAPYQQELARHGMSVGQGLRQLLAIRDHAVKDPAGYIKWFADGHKIDLSKLGAQPADEYKDPAIKALEDRIAQITGTLSSHLTIQQQQAQARQDQEIQSNVASFAQTKNPDGSLAYPYFEQVKDREMAWIAKTIRQANPQASTEAIMKVAYERAVWMNPETRKLLQDSAEAKRIADAQAHASKARLAASSVTGAPGPGSATRKDQPDDLRSQLYAAWDAQVGHARA